MIDAGDDINVSFWPSWYRVCGAAAAILGFGAGHFFGAEPVSCAVGGLLALNALTGPIRERKMWADARRYIVLGFSLLFFLLGLMVILFGSELFVQRLVTAGALLSALFACLMIFATRALVPERADDLLPVSFHWAGLIAGASWIIANEIGIALGHPSIWLSLFVFALLFCRRGLVLALHRLVLDQRP